MEQPKEYRFSPEELGLMNEIVDQIRALQIQQEGALTLIIRQQKLMGRWSFAGDRMVEEVPQETK